MVAKIVFMGAEGEGGEGGEPKYVLNKAKGLRRAYLGSLPTPP